MSKTESFKNFVSKHPELLDFIKTKETTWQDLYEIYDMYGENYEIWNKYLSKERALPIKEITQIIKGVNVGTVQKYIGNAQKAINVIQELTAKAPTKTKTIPKTSRPIHKFFGD